MSDNMDNLESQNAVRREHDAECAQAINCVAERDDVLQQREAARRMRYRDEYLTGGIVGAVARPSEARQALTYVLGSLDVGVSLEALERAIATIRKHLEA